MIKLSQTSGACGCIMYRMFMPMDPFKLMFLGYSWVFHVVFSQLTQSNGSIGLEENQHLVGVQTFYHNNGKDTSCIDYILAMDRSKLYHTKVLIRHPLNTSSHDPVCTSLNIRFTQQNSYMHTTFEHSFAKINWAKLDIVAYQQLYFRAEYPAWYYLLEFLRTSTF